MDKKLSILVRNWPLAFHAQACLKKLDLLHQKRSEFFSKLLGKF